MEKREDLRSILPYLPLVIRSSSLFWPPPVVEALKAMSEGPSHSRVDSGEVLSLAIFDIRESLSFRAHPLAPNVRRGYALFFDELMSKEESTRWFGEVIPPLANLLLRLPSLLETHYQKADNLFGGIRTGLRLLDVQEAGIVFLSQELIGALLACAFFCLFPLTDRDAKSLPAINLDHLFASLYESYSKSQENKVRCIIHYFERICSFIPVGVVSFERKVLGVEYHQTFADYPKVDFWSNSDFSLCAFEVHHSGLIEDQSGEALEVDFANKYLGGGALHRGCVQEEIRFMINPELIAGMLFLPSMDDNEAIEIVGTERFSHYTGYASSFQFGGEYMDTRPTDPLGRRKSRIVAIDALCGQGMGQFRLKCLLREINKALCGFLHRCKHTQHERLKEENGYHVTLLERDGKGPDCLPMDASSSHEVLSSSVEMNEEKPVSQISGNFCEEGGQCVDHEDKIGIVTGNWGCGAFGGDPELKAIIQWLAASQAKRPFISYYTFGVEALINLDQVTKWILSHEWTVGDLWNILVEYSSQRLHGETKLGFFSWLLPSLSAPRTQRLDSPHSPQLRTS